MMRRFAALFESLDTTTSTRLKVEAMIEYLRSCDAADAAWAIYVLMGRRVKRSVGPALLHAWLSEEAQLPGWLVEETYASIGDLAETIALLISPEGSADGNEVGRDLSLTDWLTLQIAPLANLTGDEQRRLVVGWWRELPYRECFLVNKLLTGSLRVGVSRALVTRALAELFGHSRAQIERALIGAWHPTAEFWQQLARNQGSSSVSHPYPFFLASPLESPAESLGARGDWLAEWKWDGIRGQLVRRSTECSLWSRGEEIICLRRRAAVCAPGHGRRSNLYTDYTFGVWAGETLVPVAKAYSGLTDEEIRRLDKWIRGNTREKFGMVRSVEPAHVFELAFEGIAKSLRHKSGIALRFPRIKQWRSDKAPHEADTLANLQGLLSEAS